MHTHPTLLLINGPVSVGKTTIAQRYVQDHPLALILSADEFVGSMGHWLEMEEEAQLLALKYIGLVAAEHLRAGYHVAVPYLLARPGDMAVFEAAAQAGNARLFECALTMPKDEVIARAVARGTWGEPGSPPLTKEDVPILEDKFALFTEGLAARPHMVQIPVAIGDIEGTYARLKEHLAR